MNDTQTARLLALLTEEIRGAVAGHRAAGATQADMDALLDDRRRALQDLAREPHQGGTMRTKTALQLADGSGWHYGIAGKNGGGYPLGRCASHPPHPTEAEARECYGAYVREDTIKLDAGAVGWTSCTARPAGGKCPKPTKSFAQYGDDGYGMTPLCPDHMTADDVIAAAQLDGPAGDAWIS